MNSQHQSAGSLTLLGPATMILQMYGEVEPRDRWQKCSQYPTSRRE
jgi:hypothetical protein